MSRIEVPAWVTQAFVRSTTAVGASASRDEIEQVCEEFIDLWSTPTRHFHTTRHLFDLLTRIDRLASEAQDVELVRLAAWGHGCIFSTHDQVAYTRNGGEDREASARVSGELFRSLGISDEVAREIAGLILGMRRHPLPVPESGVLEAEDMDLLVLADAHLGFLANQPQKYRAYMADLREEYAHIPEWDFVQARLEIVTRLLQRRHLFLTPLAKDWEDAARQNLESEKARLWAELAKLQGERNDDDLAADVEGSAGSRETADRGIREATTSSSEAVSLPDSSTGSASAGDVLADDGALTSNGDEVAVKGLRSDGAADRDERLDLVDVGDGITAAPTHEYKPSTPTVKLHPGPKERATMADAEARENERPPSARSGEADSSFDGVGGEPARFDAERTIRWTVAPSQAMYGGSSLEEPADHVEPGMPGRVLTPEEAKQARRDDIAQLSREKIERAREKAQADKDVKTAQGADDTGADFPSGLVE